MNASGAVGMAAVETFQPFARTEAQSATAVAAGPAAQEAVRPLPALGRAGRQPALLRQHANDGREVISGSRRRIRAGQHAP